MKINDKLFYNSNLIIFSLIFLSGFYLCFIGGYGSDEDTLPMIGAFESIKSGNEIMASRFTPYPVAELGIGFLSYYAGSWAANLVTYIFFFLSVLFFFYSFDNHNNKIKLLIFITLCLSNPFLFFDNLEPIDYSWALFPLFLGTFFYKKKLIELAVLCFGISIGARIYFFIFVFILIFFFINNFTKKRKIIIFLISFFIGGLFYLPFWFEHNFSLHWIYAATPTDQGIFGLTSRFIYKLIKSINIFPFIIILIVILQNIFQKKKKIKIDPINLIIFSNLIIFFFIPAEISYLQPFLICTYYLVCNLDRNIVVAIIILNIMSWFINFDYLKIKYKSEDICDNVNAQSAQFQFSIKNGYLKEYLITRDKIKCWLKSDTERNKKILNGEALK